MEFNEKYENMGGLKVLSGMWNNNATLQMIGDYFGGLSRERIRQIVKKYGFTQNCLTPKSIVKETIRHSPELILKFGEKAGKYKRECNKKGKLGEIIFSKLFPDFKYNGPYANCDFSNGTINIEVKLAIKKNYPNGNTNTGYHRFAITETEKKHADFVFVITPTNYYLIPMSLIKVNYISLSSKFDKYIADPQYLSVGQSKI